MHLLRLKSLTANCDFICVGVQDLHPQTVLSDLNNSFDIQHFDKARRLGLHGLECPPSLFIKARGALTPRQFIHNIAKRHITGF